MVSSIFKGFTSGVKSLLDLRKKVLHDCSSKKDSLAQMIIAKEHTLDEILIGLILAKYNNFIIFNLLWRVQCKQQTLIGALIGTNLSIGTVSHYGTSCQRTEIWHQTGRETVSNVYKSKSDRVLSSKAVPDLCVPWLTSDRSILPFH